MNQLVYIALAIFAGTMIPFQSAMNSALGRSLQSPFFSSLAVFLIAAIAVITYILATRQSVPTTTMLASAPWWSYLGGVLGAGYILLIVICAPKIGVGNATIMVLAGQLVSAIVIDHFGLLNAQVHPINLYRIGGVLLMAAGVYLIKQH